MSMIFVGILKIISFFMQLAFQLIEMKRQFHVIPPKNICGAIFERHTILKDHRI
jgi:hypothetical protein